MFFSVITKNLNWEILANFNFLKEGMGLRMKNFNIRRVHRKIRFLGEEVMKNQYIGGNCLKRRGLG